MGEGEKNTVCGSLWNSRLIALGCCVGNRTINSRTGEESKDDKACAVAVIGRVEGLKPGRGIA